MSKGGGGTSINTSGVADAANKMQQYADLAKRLAEQNYAYGEKMLTGYEMPVLDQLKQIVLGSTGTGSYVDPALNVMMQPVMQAGQQAATAAKKNLYSSGLGPVATATGAQQIDLTRMANVQTGVLSNIQTMIGQLIGAGQQGTSLMSGVPGQITGAGSLIGQSGQLETILAQLQTQAQLADNQMSMQGFQGIGTIMGLLGMTGLNKLGGGSGGTGSSAGSGAGAASTGFDYASTYGSDPFGMLAQFATQVAPLAASAFF